MDGGREMLEEGKEKEISSERDRDFMTRMKRE